MSYQSLYLLFAVICVATAIAIVQVAQHIPATLERQAGPAAASPAEGDTRAGSEH